MALSLPVNPVNDCGKRGGFAAPRRPCHQHQPPLFPGKLQHRRRHSQLLRGRNLRAHDPDGNRHRPSLSVGIHPVSSLIPDGKGHIEFSLFLKDLPLPVIRNLLQEPVHLLRKHSCKIHGNQLPVYPHSRRGSRRDMKIGCPGASGQTEHFSYSWHKFFPPLFIRTSFPLKTKAYFRIRSPGSPRFSKSAWLRFSSICFRAASAVSSKDFSPESLTLNSMITALSVHSLAPSSHHTFPRQAQLAVSFSRLEVMI